MTSHSAKRTKATIGLALVLCALLGVIAWMELGGSTSNTHNEVINRVVISRSGHQDITLTRQSKPGQSEPSQPKLWQMSSPYSLKSNEQRIDALIKLPNTLGEQYSSAEIDLVATGLTTPQASVQLNDTLYQLGDIDLSGDRRYVKHGDNVSLAPEWVWSLVHGGVSAFADLNVFDEVPESLFLHSTTTNNAPPHALSNQLLWQSLTADKIVAWQYSSAQEALAAESAQYSELRHFQLSSSNNLSTAVTLANIFRLEAYSVVQTQPGFGYAISHARLDELLQPQ